MAATRNLGDRVEIRIRDNGTGIPPEVKDKMFNPFFTTKPAGEGTGLGLSLSHDIIVKQHSGSIEVDTEPGSFTEFRIILPRRQQRFAANGRTGVSLLILVVDDEPMLRRYFGNNSGVTCVRAGSPWNSPSRLRGASVHQRRRMTPR